MTFLPQNQDIGDPSGSQGRELAVKANWVGMEPIAMGLKEYRQVQKLEFPNRSRAGH